MGRLRSSVQAKIHIENDNLIMYGSTSESAGCVLRGVLNVSLAEMTKIKSIALHFTGKMAISWTEAMGNGHERLFKDERVLMSHTWRFLPRQSKLHHLATGDHVYEFELPLAGNLPETTHIANFYLVQYRLKAVVERARFVPNVVSRQTVHLSRQVLPFSPEFMEPVSIANQWTNKLDYQITMPTKIYSHGDSIPINIRMTPLSQDIRVRYISCTLKEYMICKSHHGKPRAHGRTVFSERDDRFGINQSENNAFVVWAKTQIIPIPDSLDAVQCDVQNDAVRIRHKLKFVVSLENPDGHVSELRASMPVTICAVNTTGLPAYEDSWKSVPYDPATMLSLLFQQQQPPNTSQPQHYTPICAPITSYPHDYLPTYDELLCS